MRIEAHRKYVQIKTLKDKSGVDVITWTGGQVGEGSGEGEVKWVGEGRRVWMGERGSRWVGEGGSRWVGEGEVGGWERGK